MRVALAARPDSPSASPPESGHVRRLKEAFVQTYGGSEGDVRVFFAPGRVNLIGDHTDVLLRWVSWGLKPLASAGYDFICNRDHVVESMGETKDPRLILPSESIVVHDMV